MREDNDTLTPKKNVRRKGQRPTQEQRVEVQEKFLRAFATSGNVRAACMAAGISRTSIYAWIEQDDQFSMRYNLAQKDVDDAIRAEIYRRGMFGEERYVISQGKVAYHEGKPLTIKEKSDTLLIFHAKSRMPEYRDKQQLEVTGRDGGPVQFQHLSNLTEQELDTVERIAREAQEREPQHGK